MKNLEITTTNKTEAIKKINKFRLSNRDNWYMVMVTNENYVYHFKIFNTYVQIARKYHKKGGLIFKDGSTGDLNVSEFKQYLNKIIE